MISVEQTQTLYLGRVGEQDVTEIVFDIAPWIAQFGQGNVLLNVKRACDTIPYPANIVVVGNTAVWTVSKKDVESYGTGKAELTYMVDDKIKKSVVYKTYTEKSLADITPTPEDGQTWLDAMTKQVLKAEGQAVQSESYAHGGTGARVDENTDNAQYYYEKTKEIADGYVPGGSTGGTSNYNQLKNKPQINGVELNGNQTAEQLGLQPKGNYLKEHQDISGKADKTEIPTKVSQLQNDKGYLTEHQSLVGYAKTSEIPTKTSELTNDSGFLTEHQNISGKLDKNQGSQNNGKILGIDAQGNVIPVVKPSGGTGKLEPLTFTGGATGEYDGTKPLTVDIPTGGGGSGNNLIARYVHSGNKEIRPTNLELSTGVFTLNNHGIEDGQTCVVVPDGPWNKLPFELWSTPMESTTTLKIKVINSNEFNLSYNNKVLTFADEVNIGSVDISQWHIELLTPTAIEIDNINKKNIKVIARGYIGGTSNYYPRVFLKTKLGQITSFWGDKSYYYNEIKNPGNQSAIPNNVYLTQKIVDDTLISSINAIAPSNNKSNYSYAKQYQFLMSENRMYVYKEEHTTIVSRGNENISKVSIKTHPTILEEEELALLPTNGFTVEVYDVN